ncbi:HNH endonuclease [Rhodococcus sp. 1R11]|uniref:HNH endonuclease signature motif containing protein n=1 Tax=Rhodococcus sp. 1R11 TaxID=2559614 RepID=UPI0010725345|nr:HNH endonuclease signature motif containing protein [Rhodococcus sp. 1R11]TFI45532.1 HNH endonuclease [Rhodococcus sp. 1R11]
MGTSTRSRFAAYLGPQSKPYIEAASLAEIRDVAILENQACARKVAVAAAIWDSCIHQNVLVGDVVQDAGNYAASEIAHVLGCSKTVANSYAEIGMDLRLRLPAIAAAFGVGELDLPRVRAIYRCTHNLTQDAATAVQIEVLHAARRLSPGPLATEIWSIMYRIAPEEAAALRKDLERHTNVTYTDKDVLSTLKADLTAADAAAAWQLINEMAATVCRRDPRNKGQRRAAAYVALLHQESFMECLCDANDDHPCTADASRPDRRAPLTVITVDLATLAGLLSNPAHLAGHGTIDAEYARELAENAQWQLLLTEARNLADKLGHGDDLESMIDVDSTEDTKTDTGAGTDTENVAVDVIDGDDAGDAEPLRPPRTPHVVFHPLGRGRRRSGAVPRPLRSPASRSTAFKSTAAASTPPQSSCIATPYRGAFSLVAEFEAAIASNPTLGVARHPDGHGGLVIPPPGALVYRPSSALADSIRFRDRTCRHPGCDVPAQQCEIDHIVPYLHRDPASGGWTIATNLHCLCRYHHSLKTMGLWTPVMIADGVEFWVSNAGTTAVTGPATTQLADCGHLPTVYRRPKGAKRQADLSTPTAPRLRSTSTSVPLSTSASAHDDDVPPF